MAADHEVDVDVVNRSTGLRLNRPEPPHPCTKERPCTTLEALPDGAVRIVFQDPGSSPRPTDPSISPFLDSNGNVVSVCQQQLDRSD